ncbi:MAG: twin-arginine translocation signal domain-containing protein [Draconibacterium sp.]|nr:twin-arginine translocation signal domain-containing protein [Draconibacterium sp.]
MNRNKFSRRDFVKTGVLSSAAVAGAGTLASCSTQNNKCRKEPFPVFKGEGFNSEQGVAGLLFSQVGYEPELPVRILVRLPEKDLLPETVDCVLTPIFQENEYQADCIYWGEIWKSHWWVAEFPVINEEGEWDVEIRNEGKIVIKDYGLKIRKNILWDSTIEWSSVDMLERRRHFTGLGVGWQDAGAKWAESPAQSAMIIALEELLEHKKETFDEEFIKRIYEQIICGCDYLILTQKKAHELGFPQGAMSHDVLGHEKDILPHDVSKAVVALMKAARLLPDSYSEKKSKYEKAAKLSFSWLINTAKPMGDYGYVKMQRGLSDEVEIPKNEWPTRDLITMIRASLEMIKSGMQEAKDLAIDFTQQVLERQIPEEKAMSGFYGHFYEFDSMDHAEPSWTHGIVPSPRGSQFGTDMGGVYPNYLVPIIELLEMFPEHDDVEKWKQTLSDFAYGYLIPACEANPFKLVPQLINKEEGAIWFCGTFHGTNSIYGFTAALAFELQKVLNEPKLKDIAYGNLQWLAGLNSGMTAETLKTGCVIFSTDIPDGAALPASMICHVGNRWGGTWFQTRGVICNGFTTGAQFKYDTSPLKENDGPFSLTDEDWIPHSAGWLTGLMRLIE